MKRILLVLMVFVMVAPAIAFAQDAEQSTEPWVWTNGLKYGPQFQQNLERGTTEIVDAPKRIEPSIAEYQHTKTGVPGLDQFFTGLLMVTNFMDSCLKGTWRIMVSPIPIGNKVQP